MKQITVILLGLLLLSSCVKSEKEQHLDLISKTDYPPKILDIMSRSVYFGTQCNEYKDLHIAWGFYEDSFGDDALSIYSREDRLNGLLDELRKLGADAAVKRYEGYEYLGTSRAAKKHVLEWYGKCRYCGVQCTPINDVSELCKDCAWVNNWNFKEDEWRKEVEKERVRYYKLTRRHD